MVDAADHDSSAGDGRIADGGLSTWTTAFSIAPLRPGFAQYTSEDFQRLLEAHGIVCSMSRRGNCWDNAAVESFFSTLKTERLSRKSYRTRDELRADVFDYIERFYAPKEVPLGDNQKRRHSTIGYISPVQFENLQCA